jgi:hypothetical protein
VLAAALVAGLIIAVRGLGADSLGAWLVPAAGIVAVLAFGRRCARVHPDEPWLPQLLFLGVVVKLVASYVRYFTLTEAYGSIGDSLRYERYAHLQVAAWEGQQVVVPELDSLRQTDFMKWLTAIVYYLFGQSLMAGFLLFGLLAVVGSYFWYRGVATGIPYADKRLFLIFMMFAPSIVFWPSSLGKEALMQLSLGAAAWAAALMLNGRFLQALPLAAGAGWLLWVIRPHLLALATIAAAVPYFLGRIRHRSGGGIVARPLGMVAIALLVLFTVTAGAEFLGIEDLSIESIEAELDETTERSSKGGSQFEHSGNSLSPLALPQGLVTVLFRPFPWEAGTGFQLLAAAEAMAVLGLIAFRFESITLGIRRARLEPFLLFCWTFLLLSAMTYSAFANFGLLNRQRSLILPALYALIAVSPDRFRTWQERRESEQPDGLVPALPPR